MIGNLNSIEATAEKLSIPQLQQALRDGTLPPYVGIPLLQKKVQEQKRMQAAAQMNPQAANQPPVAQRIMQEAQGVDTLHSNLPEEYAGGGIIAFAGKDGSYVEPSMATPPSFYDAISGYDDEIEKNRQLAELYKTKGIRGVLGSKADEAVKNLAAIKQGIGSTTSNVYGSVVNPLVKYWYGEEGTPQPQAITQLAPQPTPAPQVQTPAATQPAAPKPAAGPIPYENLPQGARDMQARILEKQINDKYHFDPYADEPTQAPAPAVAPTQEAPAQGIKSLADYQNEYRNLAGENKGIAEIRAELAKSREETAKDKERAPWMALMQAGLATMAGTSPYALANIGAGGAKGLEAFAESQKDLRKEQDKYLDMQAKLGQAEREEYLAALKYGTDSVKFDKAEANKEKLLREELASREKVSAATNEANKEIAKTRVRDETNSVAMHNRTFNLNALNSYIKRKDDLGLRFKPESNPEHADIQRNIDKFSRLVSEAAAGGAGAAGGSKILNFEDLVRETGSAQ